MPGKAKTRLIPPLTLAGAADLQRAMTEDLLERFARVFGADDPALERPEALSLEVRCDGDPSAGALDIPAAWTVIPQGSGDLGERLTRAARDARRDGVRSLVIIGSDAPLLAASLVEAGFRTLAARDAVLVPAEDGGYVLIGVAPNRIPKGALDGLFAGIPWGTDAVREATRAAAAEAGISLEELSRSWDVDRPADLARLRAAIEALGADERPRRTAAVLTAAGY